MQGYGKEVYITESDYSQYVKLDGKEYEISSSSYYDDETGNSSKDLKVFDVNNKTLYSYNEFSNLDDICVCEKCLQFYNALFVHKVSCFYRIITASLLSIFNSCKVLYFHYNEPASLL